MRVDFVCLAQAPPPTPLWSHEKKVALWSDDLAGFVALGLIALLVLAFFAKKSFGGWKRKRVSESRSVPQVASLPRAESPSENRRRRKRRRRRAHRPSNPTLAETGGLPLQRGKKFGNDSSEV
ncbi:MAG: hypothetical protein M2R45_01732 [Verrucomicrobia subdivision 3 bacterium]|nr:hypothetical protein [Limisphaerales bacterium]MCS1413469.1 hypothetical protein [Limisphaerales bacterium]